jgi:GDP-4-dehydro-6-deoxy-D-mannose reductase
VRALVTGGRGFAGSHLCAHLQAMGDEVVSADRGGEPGLDIVDREATYRTFAEHRPEVVYHLAALTHVGESWATPTAFLRVNVEGTANVLAAASAAGAGCVVVVGSSEEYGRVDERDLPLSEDAPLRPATPYGVSKVAASFIALQAHLGTGLRTVRVRPFNHTGPGQADRFVVPALARRIAEAERDGRDEIVVGSLDPVRDISDVRDIVRAYRLAALHGEPGEVYNVCSEQGVSVAKVVERLVALCSRELRVVQDPALLRPVDVPVLVGTSAKLRAATGWSPAFDLDQTLADVLAEARASV